MLDKLLKYDLKWIYKGLVVFYILALVFAVLGRSLSLIENSFLFGIISKICYGITIVMLISALINTLIRVWARVIKNMYKDESYLTHTLPVEKSKIYLSKFIAAIITMFTTILVSVVCLAICYYSQENIEFIKSMFEIAETTYNSNIISLLITVAVTLFLEMVFVLTVGIAGIIIGHKSNDNKIVKSIVYAFAMYMVTQAIGILLVVLFGVFNPDIMNLLNTVEAVDINVIKLILYGGIILYLIYVIVYYMIGKKQFEKGVNVE